MTAPLNCPGAEGWQSLLDLDVEPEQLSHFERHLPSCPACQDRLDRAEADEEEFRRRARRVGDPTVVPVDPTLSDFLERLQEGEELNPAPSTDPAEFYFLRPSDRPDILGTLGDYEVQEVIGQGGMGVVLKAYEPALHRLVAIKVLAPSLAGSPTARRRFTREAQAAAAVVHDHIVTVHGVHETDGLPYLVMQYVPGESLQERLDLVGPLDVTDTVRIGLQTASGLAAAHAQGLVHRDIKPANLLLEDGLARVRITDFGLARSIDDVGLTQTGVVPGTPEYMSPEQARGEPLDHRTDLFSLGSVLYALCAGEPPFQGPSTVAVLRKVSDAEPPSLRTLNPATPDWLIQLIALLLAKAPADRIQSAAEVAALLEGYLAHLRQPGTVPPPELHPVLPKARAEPRWSRFRGRLARWLRPGRLAMLVALASLGLWLFFFLQAAPPPKPAFAHEFYCDFRGRQPLPSSFTLAGPDIGEVIKHEEKGLRITLPATRRSNVESGVKTTFAVAGDFEITGTYELLSIDRPPDGNGVSVALTIATDNDLSKFGKISRCLRPERGDVYQTEFWIKGEPDSGQHWFVPTTARAGQLRLVRHGSTLLFLAADGLDNEFREINRREYTAEDVERLRFGANNSGSPAGVDARLIDLRVRFDHVAPYKPFDKAKAFDRSQGWSVRPLVVVGIGLGLLLCALGMLLHVRRRTRILASPGVPVIREGGEEKPVRADSVAAAPSIVFPCAGCGKNLRVRAALAGKSVKCPACGQRVLVPETNPGSLAPRESTGTFSILKNRGVVGSMLVLAVVAGLCNLLFWPSWFAGSASGSELTTGPAMEYYHSFKTNPEMAPSMELWGPDPERYVKFEPAGLRINLPPHYRGGITGPGVVTRLPMTGDFEITMSYEILKEPRPLETAEPAPPGVDAARMVNYLSSRLSLGVVLDRPELIMATLSRRIASKGGIQYHTWSSVHRTEESSNHQVREQAFPTTATSGQLRLVRNGSIISYWVSDGPGKKPFTFLQQYPFAADDVKEVRIVGATDGPTAGLDVRVIDLSIHGWLPAKPKNDWWRVGLVIALVLTLTLGAWLALRLQLRVGKVPAHAAAAGEQTKAGAALPARN